MAILKVEISEDNGFLFGGTPSLVVITVHLDDGRKVRCPYPADKAICSLYEDFNRISPQVVSTPDLPVLTPSLPIVAQEKPLPLAVQQAIQEVDKSGVVEKGDIVKCVRLENRNDHGGTPATQDLVVGNKYRVTKVGSTGYEVLDDSAPLQLKLFLFKHEAELIEKHKPYEKKVLFIEEGLNCPKCNTLVYCGLHDGFYTGNCECGADIKISREEVKGGQASNRSVA